MWVLLFVCLPATNPAQFNSLWPIWVATLRTKLSLVVGINLATNFAQFNSPWQNWVAIPPLILPPILSLVFLPALTINPDVNSAVVRLPPLFFPSPPMSIFDHQSSCQPRGLIPAATTFGSNQNVDFENETSQQSCWQPRLLKRQK